MPPVVGPVQRPRAGADESRTGVVRRGLVPATVDRAGRDSPGHWRVGGTASRASGMLGGMSQRPVDDDPHPARALPDAEERSESAEPVRPHRALPPEDPQSAASPDTAVLRATDAPPVAPARPASPTSPATSVLPASQASPNTTVLAGGAVRGDDEPVELSAWQQPWTRKLAKARRVLPLVALLIGVLAAIGCVVLVLRGGLEQVWGLPVLVVGAGLAGGCLSGGVLGLLAYQRLRGVLQSGPWHPATVELGQGNRARLLPDGPAAEPQPLELDVRATRLGERGARVPIQALAQDDRIVLATTDQTRLIRTWPGRG